jgi:hypothetical protein
MSPFEVPVAVALIVLAGLGFLIWLAAAMIHGSPVVTPAEYESVHYLGRCEVKGCNAPARFKVESPRGVRMYCRKCLEGGAK